MLEVVVVALVPFFDGLEKIEAIRFREAAAAGGGSLAVLLDVEEDEEVAIVLDLIGKTKPPGLRARAAARLLLLDVFGFGTKPRIVTC